MLDIVEYNQLDLLIFAEAEKLDTQYLLSTLRKNGKNFEVKKILPKREDILVIAERKIKVIVAQEESHYSIYKIIENNQYYLLFVVHLDSALHKDERARNARVQGLSSQLRQFEERCNEEQREKILPCYEAIVVGDFNLHPFSEGIVGMHGFNAVFDLYKAKDGVRKYNGESLKFYYNPMWKLMGKSDQALGTYYSASDSSDCSFYWYTFDQVLIRPSLISRFIWDEFEIITEIGKKKLTKNGKIDKKVYSDHLPIKFEIR